MRLHCSTIVLFLTGAPGPFPEMISDSGCGLPHEFGSSQRGLAGHPLTGAWPAVPTSPWPFLSQRPFQMLLLALLHPGKQHGVKKFCVQIKALPFGSFCSYYNLGFLICKMEGNCLHTTTVPP
jgi:hypothetical protein